MSTPISPSQAAFNTLEVNLKAVLLQTGSALSHTSSDNGNSLLSTRTHLEKALPDALRKWHGALNDLEEQLWNAKATLHRDLDSLRRSKSSTANQLDQTSPAQSLDSDTVMVEAPSNHQSAYASPHQANSSTGDLTKDDLVLVENSQKGTPNMQTSTPQGQTTTTNTSSHTSSHDSSQEPTQKNASLLQEAEANLVPSPKDVNFTTDSPIPSIEPAPLGNSFDNAANDIANTDVGELLPGLMDYANTGMPGSGDISDSAPSFNLDDFSADRLFPNQPGIGHLDANGLGAANNLDDLFGETDFAAAGNGTTFSQNQPGDLDTFSQNQPGNLDTTFNFDDLIANGEFNPNSADPSAEFDPSLFNEDFFNLGGDDTGNGT